MTPDVRSFRAASPVSGAKWAMPASEILQPRRSSRRSFLAPARCGKAGVADLGVEQRQIRQLRHLADAGHAVVGNPRVALQVERLEFLERDEFGQSGVGDSSLEQLQVFEMAER